jgi:ATP-dependent Clp protease ATP-binding subunit ClpX
VKYILVTRDAALLKCAPLYFHRGQIAAFHASLSQEEEKWDDRNGRKEDTSNNPSDALSSFEEYRKVGTAAGF